MEDWLQDQEIWILVYKDIFLGMGFYLDVVGDLPFWETVCLSVLRGDVPCSSFKSLFTLDVLGTSLAQLKSFETILFFEM
jgi:hypothetical protein